MRRVVYSNYLLPYLLILFPPILLSIAFYFSSFRLVEGLEQSSVAISLSNTGGLIESRMDDLRQIVTTLSFDPGLLAAASRNEPVTRSSFYSLIEAHNNLPPYQLTNDLVHSYYLYFRGIDTIMSSETVSFRLPIFYESSLRYENLTFADWKSYFLEGSHSNEVIPPMNVFSGATSEPLLTYVNSFPPTYFGHSSGTTILLLRKERLDRFLSQIAVQDGSWAVLVNSDWQTLADAGPVLPKLTAEDLWASIEHSNVEAGSIEFDAEDQRYDVFFTSMPELNWMLISGIPRELHRTRLVGLRTLALVISVSSLFIGIALAVVLAIRRSAIVVELTSLLGSVVNKGGYRNPLNQVKSSVARVVAENQQFRSALKEDGPLLMTAFIGRLLRGEVTSEDELRSHLSQSALEKYYLCVVVQIDGFGFEMTEEILHEMSMARVILKSIIDRQIENVDLVSDLQRDRVALIIESGRVAPSPYKPTLEKLCGRIQEGFTSKTNMSTRYFVGTRVKGLLAIHQSYERARQMADTQFYYRKSISWFDEVTEEPGWCLYSMDVERSLINSIRSARHDRITQIFETIHEENCVRRNLNAGAFSDLLSEIRCTLRKAAGQALLGDQDKKTIERDLLKLQGTQDAEACLDSASNIAIEIANKFEENKKSHNVTLINQIVGYVELHYAEYDLSLSELSSEFQLSEVYLSRFFKEQTGENYLLFITRLKMDRATELLHDPTIRIEEIAHAVGYRSPNTFLKAFRRWFADTPTSYREKIGVK